MKKFISLLILSFSAIHSMQKKPLEPKEIKVRLGLAKQMFEEGRFAKVIEFINPILKAPYQLPKNEEVGEVLIRQLMARAFAVVFDYQAAHDYIKETEATILSRPRADRSAGANEFLDFAFEIRVGLASLLLQHGKPKEEIFAWVRPIANEAFVKDPRDITDSDIIGVSYTLEGVQNPEDLRCRIACYKVLTQQERDIGKKFHAMLGLYQDMRTALCRDKKEVKDLYSNLEEVCVELLVKCLKEGSELSRSVKPLERLQAKNCIEKAHRYLSMFLVADSAKPITERIGGLECDRLPTQLLEDISYWAQIESSEPIILQHLLYSFISNLEHYLKLLPAKKSEALLGLADCIHRRVIENSAFKDKENGVQLALWNTKLNCLKASRCGDGDAQNEQLNAAGESINRDLNRLKGKSLVQARFIIGYPTLASIYWKLGNPEKAEKYFELMINQVQYQGMAAKAKVAYAQMLTEQKRYKKAVKILDSAKDFFEKNVYFYALKADYKMALAQAYIGLGDVEAANKCFLDCITFKSQLVAAHRADLELQFGRFYKDKKVDRSLAKEALHYVSDQSHNPNAQIEAHLELAQIALDEENFAEVEIRLNSLEGLLESKKDPRITMLWAKSCFARKEFKKAEALFSKLDSKLLSDLSKAECFQKLAYIKLLEHANGEAANLLERCQKFGESQSDLLKYLQAICAIRSGEYENALGKINEMRGCPSSINESRINAVKGIILVGLNRFEEGMNLLRSIEKDCSMLTDLETAEFCLALGYGYEQIEDSEKANYCYRLAGQSHPLLYAALNNEDLGDSDAVVTFYRIAERLGVKNDYFENVKLKNEEQEKKKRQEFLEKQRQEEQALIEKQERKRRAELERQSKERAKLLEKHLKGHIQRVRDLEHMRIEELEKHKKERVVFYDLYKGILNLSNNLQKIKLEILELENYLNRLSGKSEWEKQYNAELKAEHKLKKRKAEALLIGEKDPKVRTRLAAVTRSLKDVLENPDRPYKDKLAKLKRELQKQERILGTSLKALKKSTESEDIEIASRANGLLGILCERENNFEEARLYLRLAEQELSQLPETEIPAFMLSYGACLEDAGDIEQALGYYSLAKDASDKEVAIEALRRKAYIFKKQGKLEKALDALMGIEDIQNPLPPMPNEYNARWGWQVDRLRRHQLKESLMRQLQA